MPDDRELASLEDDFAELDSLLDVNSKEHRIQRAAFQATPDSVEPEIRLALARARTRLQRARDDINETLKAIPGADDDAEKNGLAVQALTTFGSLDANVNDVVATSGVFMAASGAAPPPGPLGTFLGKLKSVLAKIQSGILSFLAKYMNFQSWSIAGQLTGGVPWLSGSATLTLTFGP